MAIRHYEMTPEQYEKLMGELVVQADINLERALKAEAENARLAAEIEQLKRELHVATGSRQALALELQIVQAQLEQA